MVRSSVAIRSHFAKRGGRLGRADLWLPVRHLHPRHRLGWAEARDRGLRRRGPPDGTLARPEGDPPLVAGEPAVAGLAALKRAMTDAAARGSLGLALDARVLVFGTEADTDAELLRELAGADAEAVGLALHEFAPD